MDAKKILIVGGGIAGNALALILSKHNFDITVIERFPDLRSTGLQLDLRGHGVEVLRRMDLEAPFRAKSVPEQGLRVVDDHGRTRAFFPANRSGQGLQSFTSDFEIMRGDFVRLLYDRTVDSKNVKHLFGITIKSIEQQTSKAMVTFSSGETQEFDLIIGAAGQGSYTRRMMLASGAPDPVNRLSISMAYFTAPASQLPNIPTDCTVFVGPEHRLVMTRKSNPEIVQVYLGCPAEILESVPKGNSKAEKEVFSERYANVKWEVPAIMKAMHATPDFYCERAGVIKLSSWSNGRIVLVGDAAYCPTANTGMGTSSALVGSYILANELIKACNPTSSTNISDLNTSSSNNADDPILSAVHSYETIFRPFMTQVQADIVEEDQKDGGFMRFIPTSSWGITIMYYILAIASFLRLNKLSTLMLSEQVLDWSLPIYDHEDVRG